MVVAAPNPTGSAWYRVEWCGGTNGSPGEGAVSRARGQCPGPGTGLYGAWALDAALSPELPLLPLHCSASPYAEPVRLGAVTAMWTSLGEVQAGMGQGCPVPPASPSLVLTGASTVPHLAVRTPWPGCNSLPGHLWSPWRLAPGPRSRYNALTGAPTTAAAPTPLCSTPPCPTLTWRS